MCVCHYIHLAKFGIFLYRKFCAQSLFCDFDACSRNPRTFNPADYSDSASTNGCGIKSGVWEAAQNSKNESSGKYFLFIRYFLFGGSYV